jgi:hypothetical protein
MALVRPPSRMYDSTNNADNTIATMSGMPSSASSTMDSAYRLTPAMSMLPRTKVIALIRWAFGSNRSRRYSGTLRTLEP